MRVSVIIPSYNKVDYIGEAVASVLRQTHTNFELLILENSTDENTTAFVHEVAAHEDSIHVLNMAVPDREIVYAESFVKNHGAHLAEGSHILFLADDDLLEPECLAEHVADFERNPDHRANYHQVVMRWESSGHEHYMPNEDVFDANRLPLERIDGGAVMFEKALLLEIPRPWFRQEMEHAPRSDGHFLNEIAMRTPIWPIWKALSVKRLTPSSTWQKG